MTYDEPQTDSCRVTAQPRSAEGPLNVMRVRFIRWKRLAPWQAKRDCAAWLREQGYGVTPIFGDLWLIGRGWP
jgi:hypothetical protein